MSRHWDSSFPKEKALVLVVVVVVEVVASVEVDVVMASLSEHLSTVVRFSSMFG